MKADALCDQASQAASSAAVYRVLYRALSDRPNPDVFRSVRELAALLNVPDAVPSYDEHQLDQAFYDRMVVPSSLLHVPPVESCIRLAVREPDGSWTFAATGGAPMTQAVACYKPYGFDWRLLSGFGPLVKTMPADHIAAEVAFMAHLREVQAEGGPAGQAAGAYAQRFLAEKLGAWCPRLACLARQKADDFYALVFSCLAAWVQLDAEPR